MGMQDLIPKWNMILIFLMQAQDIIITASKKKEGIEMKWKEWQEKKDGTGVNGNEI